MAEGGGSGKGAWTTVVLLALLLAIVLISQGGGNEQATGTTATAAASANASSSAGGAPSTSTAGTSSPSSGAVPGTPGVVSTVGTGGVIIVQSSQVIVSGTVTMQQSGSTTITTSIPSTSPSAGSLMLTANGAPLLPAAASGQSLTKYAGQGVVASGVPVFSVPADKGFWVGTSDVSRVYVELAGHGSVTPHPVRVGDHVIFAGTMVVNTSSFVGSAGLSQQDVAQLTAQGAHIVVSMTAISFA
jgi:hypothetical protein